MTIDEILQQFHEKRSGDAITDFTCAGECSKCGSCCSAFLPLTRTEFKKLRKLAKKHGIYVHEGADVDCTCPFLNEHNQCSIYDDRPLICQIFTCHDWERSRENHRGLLNMHPRRTYDLRKELKGRI